MKLNRIIFDESLILLTVVHFSSQILHLFPDWKNIVPWEFDEWLQARTMLKSIVDPQRWILAPEYHFFVEDQSKKIEVVGQDRDKYLSFLLHESSHKLMDCFYCEFISPDD